MAPHFLISRHALARFVERYQQINQLTPDRYRQFLLEELERSVPFVAQPHYDQFLLLACGCVAAVVWHNGIGFVKTVLTQGQALDIGKPWSWAKRTAA